MAILPAIKSVVKAVKSIAKPTVKPVYKPELPEGFRFATGGDVEMLNEDGDWVRVADDELDSSDWYADYQFQSRGLSEQNLYHQIEGGNLPVGWSPKTYDIPLFEEWLAAKGPGYLDASGKVVGTTDNSAYYQYLDEFFNKPSYGGTDFLNMAPLLMAGGFAGLAAGGMLAPYAAGAVPGAVAASPAIAGATAGAVQGAGSAVMNDGNLLESALRGAAAGGAGGAVAGQLGGFVDNPIAQGAIRGAVGGVVGGQNPLHAAAVGGVASGLEELDFSVEEPMADVAGRSLSGPGMLGEHPMPYQAPMTPRAMEPLPGSYAMPYQAPMAALAMEPLPLSSLAQSTAALVEEPEGSEPAAPEGETDLVSEPPAPAKPDYAAYAKKAQDAYKAVFGDSADVPPFDAPEGQSDEEYAVEYLSLSPEAMAEAGLTPGTPEYLAYILEQADAIIAGVFGDDPGAVIEGASVEDLQNALSELAESEAQQLLRALYVRGALGQTTDSGTVTDPFTGVDEETGMLPGPISGPQAGQQRGYARALQDLLAMPRGQAAESFRGLLGRDIDLFGLQGAADARSLAEQLAQLEEEELRRRRGSGGMVGGDAGYWHELLSSMDPRELERLMSQFGDSRRQGAAVEQLMGRKR